MGATSVTGKGIGAAYNNKGPHNGRDVYVPLVSPHVVAAGHATTAGGGTIAVVFPTALPNAPTSYAVIVTAADTGATTTGYVSAKAGSTTFTGFTITGHASKIYAWVVVTVGSGS